MSDLTHQLVFLARHVGDVHIVGGWTEVFKFFASKDIDGDKVDFCMTVLPGLGCTHFHNLARATLDDNETVLAEGRTLHGIGR